jgi:hypothetical protein
LRALIAATQKHHNLRTAMHIVDPVSRPVVDAHFLDALTNASSVAGIPHLHAANATNNATALAFLRRCSQPENATV